MKLKDEIRFLNSLDKRITKNIIKHAWKDPKARVGIIFFSIYTVFIFYLILSPRSSSGIYEITRNDWELYSFMYIFFLGFISLFSALFSSAVMPGEREFLLPRPISVRSIILKKLIKGYIVCIFIIVIANYLMYNYFKDESFVEPIDYLLNIYAGTTFIFAFFGFVPLTLHSIGKLPKNRSLKIFKWVMTIILGISFLEFIYLLFNHTLIEEPGIIFTEVLKTPPLNVFLLFPLSSVYICIADVYDIYFWLAVIGNGVFFIIIFISSIKFNYSSTLAESITGSTQRTSQDIEISTKDMWWRRGIFKDTLLDYPRIKEGEGAVMEIGLLMGTRLKFGIPYLFFIVILMMTILIGPSSNVPDEFMIVMGVLFFFILAVMIPLLDLNENKYGIIKTLPLKGLKLYYYLLLPNMFFILAPYYGTLCFMIMIGYLTDVILIIVFFIVGTIFLSLVMAASECGYLFFISEKNLVPNITVNNAPQMGAFFGGFLFGITIFLINIVLYILISDIITDALKFLFIGLTDIGLIFLLGYMYKIEFNKLGIKKRYRGRRLAVGIVVLIILSYFSIGLPLADFFDTYSDIPTSWDEKVRDEFVIENDFVYYDDYLFITSSGSMFIINSTIVFNCTEEYSFGIYLDEDGWLFIENSTITTIDSRYGIKFIMYGYAWINNTIIENIGSETRPAVNGLGVQIYSNDVSIANSYIYNSKGNGITCNDGLLEIYETHILNCGDDGIDLFDSTAYIFNCTIESNSGHGIYSEDSESYIYYCILRNNNGYGIRIDGGKYEMEDNIFEGNEKGDIKK